MNPATPDIVRARIREIANRPYPKEFNKGMNGAIIGKLNKVLGGDDNRHLVLGLIFLGKSEMLLPISSSDLTPPEWKGLEMWIGSKKVEEQWIDQPEFSTEARWMSTRADWIYCVSQEGLKVGQAYSIAELMDFYPKLAPLSIDSMGVVDYLIGLGGEITQVIEGVENGQ